MDDHRLWFRAVDYHTKRMVRSKEIGNEGKVNASKAKKMKHMEEGWCVCGKKT